MDPIPTIAVPVLAKPTTDATRKPSTSNPFSLKRAETVNSSHHCPFHRIPLACQCASRDSVVASLRRRLLITETALPAAPWLGAETIPLAPPDRLPISSPGPRARACCCLPQGSRHKIGLHPHLIPNSMSTIIACPPARDNCGRSTARRCTRRLSSDAGSLQEGHLSAEFSSLLNK